MPRDVFGLQIPDELSHDWESVGHLLVGELREDDSIDFYLILDGGTQRYLATAGGSDMPGIIEAPRGLDRLCEMTREVLRTNTPIARTPTMQHEGLLLSVHPVRGPRPRVAVILEPADESTRVDAG